MSSERPMTLDSYMHQIVTLHQHHLKNDFLEKIIPETEIVVTHLNKTSFRKMGRPPLRHKHHVVTSVILNLEFPDQENIMNACSLVVGQLTGPQEPGWPEWPRPPHYFAVIGLQPPRPLQPSQYCRPPHNFEPCSGPGLYLERKKKTITILKK